MSMLAKPLIPRSKMTFKGKRTPRVAPSVGEVVAIPLQHDWGPLGSELSSGDVRRALTEFDEWTERWGDSDTEGRTAIIEAFAGHNLAGALGAGGVIPWRMGTNAARSSLRIQNTAGTPRDAITITAKWTGTRGDDFSVVVDADPANAANDRLRLKFRGAVVETYSYPRADIAKLVNSITTRDTGNITATLLVDGTALATTAGSDLRGGDDGDAPTSGDYMDALAGLEFQPFTILAPANLTDESIQTAIVTWVQQQDEQDRPVMFVVGGAAGETIDDALDRTIALPDPHVVNFGVGTYYDDLVEKELSTAQLAPRIAGILAARGKKQSLTAARLGGLHAVGTTGCSIDDAEVAVQNGVTVAIRTEADDADLRIAKGLTTFTDDDDPDRPRDIYEEPRHIRIMDLFKRDMRLWGDTIVIGNVPVNQSTRDAVRQQGNVLIGELLRDGLVLTRADGAIDDPFIATPRTTDDTVPYNFGWQFARTANYLLGNGTVR